MVNETFSQRVCCCRYCSLGNHPSYIYSTLSYFISMHSNSFSDTIRRYFQLITFSHTIFALPFAIIGFTLGLWRVSRQSGLGSVPVVKLFLLVIVCMVTARSAAMAFNRYLDRNFDARNPRTALREIPAGMIAAILFYSYTKRFTPLCHLVLGVGLSLAPIGPYLSITGAFSLLPILFSMAVVGWVSGFDIIYSLQDEEFDREHQLNSIPVWLGKKRALQVAVTLHIACAIFLATAGFTGPFGYLYWLAYALFVAMLIYQHSLVKPTDLSKVNRAFMTANGIASVIFGILVVIDIIRQL